MSSSDRLQRQRKGLYRSNAIDVLCVLVLIAYFLHFAVPSLAGGFNDDEMMNIYAYWRLGALKSLWANICFWKGIVRPIGRPAGALYYLPLYHFFSLNPQPYRVVQVSILAASIPMVYYLTRLLASCRSVAFLAVLALCYHAQLANLVFVGSFIYDVLCGFFYFAALTYYIHIREREIALRPTQLLGCLALYICALNSKEMAVTLPVIILVYELLKYYHQSERQKFRRWILHDASPALTAGVITAIYCYNKIYGPSSWIVLDIKAYIPHYSWHTFTESNAHFLSELFYRLVPIDAGMVLAAWALVFLYAFLRRDRMLQLMAFWIVITPLPLAFIQLRGGACLYILLFGWAMIFAKLASDVITLISKSSIWLGQGVGVGATTGAIIAGAATNRVRGAAIGAAVGAAASKMSPPIFRVFATILVASALAMFTQWENQRFGRNPALLNSGQKTLHVIQAFRSLDLHPSPGSMILLRPENGFYQGGWYPVFVAALVWNDHSLRIYAEGQHQVSQQQIANMNYIISFNEFHAKLIPVP
ncbi:MAG: hypothetical protein DME20_03290 [Verrucomicrobia bacterium]|nr:MAG: hypothetical protein DME20_03290 [Verrucomicrobiota bacterium]